MQTELHSNDRGSGEGVRGTLVPRDFDFEGRGRGGGGIGSLSDADADYAADMREAYMDRQEQVADELADIEASERERRDEDYADLGREARHLREQCRAWLRAHGAATGVKLGRLNEVKDGELFESATEGLDSFMSMRFHTDGCTYCQHCASLGANGLGNWLAHMCGEYKYSFDPLDIEVVSRSAALLDAEGRRALGMYALLGDAAATFAVIEKCLSLEYGKGRATDARSQCTNWVAMARLFAESVPAGMVLFATGVDPASTRAGGEALEALIGIVASDLGMPAAYEFSEEIGLFKNHRFS